MNSPLPTVWTNDDTGAGNAPELRRQLELIDRFEIPGVFFVIPENRNGPIDRDRDLLRVIEAAREKGHEFYQHGYRHFAFECGIPLIQDTVACWSNGHDAGDQRFSCAKEVVVST